MIQCSQGHIAADKTERLKLKSELRELKVKMEGYLKELGYE